MAAWKWAHSMTPTAGGGRRQECVPRSSNTQDHNVLDVVWVKLRQTLECIHVAANYAVCWCESQARGTHRSRDALKPQGQLV